jgi:hypothetical protein
MDIKPNTPAGSCQDSARGAVASKASSEFLTFAWAPRSTAALTSCAQEIRFMRRLHPHCQRPGFIKRRGEPAA